MSEFIKRFTEWLFIKSKLNVTHHEPPLFREREVWWCSIGENIGVEISGKGNYFRRPVLIVRKLDKYSFIGIPFTQTFREGSWYKQLVFNDRLNTAILSQIRHFDYRRMAKIIGTVSEIDFSNIKDGLASLLLLK